jgi:undecaprenyl phosphate N,N'-diacetylbacillosamine 1-phosphate transferase
MTYERTTKRIFDIIISLFILAHALPVLLFSTIAIALFSPGPIFFRQRRVGLKGKTFDILKLRTMNVNPMREVKQTMLTDPEVFFVGRFLRRLKIDELPQIFNVLLGEMSIVGPRPCLETTFSAMPDWAKRRTEVRPGITGQAQINGNTALTWEERWLHDIDYINNISFSKDIRILSKTILVVFLGEDKFKDIK